MRKSRKHHIEALAALMLFALYALCIFGVIMAGTGIFSRLSARDDAAFERRSLENYIPAKLRRSDFSGALSVEGDYLILAEEEGYETRIYCHEGYVRELFTRCGAEADPSAGEKLLPAEAMELRFEDGLLIVELDRRGENSTLRFDVKSAGEVSP